MSDLVNADLIVNERGKPRKRPVIGILAQYVFDETEKLNGEQAVYDHVVRFAQMGGSLVTPIWVDEPDEYYEELVLQINGLILPGALTNDPLNSGYAKAAHRLIKLAIQLNDGGTYFPIFGLCAGFQTFTAYVTGQNLLTRVDAYQMNRKLELSTDISSSRLLSCLTNDALNIMVSETTMFHLHYYGVRLKDFNSDSRLTDFFHVISSTIDNSGEVIVSTVEAKNYPFYATQWHSDKYSFWSSSRFPMPWTPKYNCIGQQFANFLTLEALKNDQHFNSEADETSHLIDNPVSSKTVFLPFRETGHYKPSTTNESLVRTRNETMTRSS
ncbi:gamma-glutamyl hydrolase-like [Tubulanus polymorphus]|uniref:gamma-glutamyl hydrolase-like n=1 Tax=Tubulanus polymorphus TaxID=672921 RepID=UPI003DA1F579